MNNNSIRENYIDLDLPYEYNHMYRKAVYKEMINEFTPIFNYKNLNKLNNSFINTPFGSDKYNMYWTIEANSLSKQRFECGSSHDYNKSIGNLDNEPSKVETHHMIFFRGSSLNKEDAHKRFSNKLKNISYLLDT